MARSVKEVPVKFAGLKNEKRKWSAVIYLSELAEEFDVYERDNFSDDDLLLEALQKRKIKFDAAQLSTANRTTMVNFKECRGQEGTLGFLFARVEEGVEKEFLQGVLEVLNKSMNGTWNERKARYNKMVILYSDVILKDFKVMRRRKADCEFPVVRRQKRGCDIIYEEDIITGGQNVPIWKDGDLSISVSQPKTQKSPERVRTRRQSADPKSPVKNVTSGEDEQDAQLIIDLEDAGSSGSAIENASDDDRTYVPACSIGSQSSISSLEVRESQGARNDGTFQERRHPSEAEVAAIRELDNFLPEEEHALPDSRDDYLTFATYVRKVNQLENQCFAAQGKLPRPDPCRGVSVMNQKTQNSEYTRLKRLLRQKKQRVVNQQRSKEREAAQQAKKKKMIEKEAQKKKEAEEREEKRRRDNAERERLRKIQEDIARQKLLDRQEAEKRRRQEIAEAKARTEQRKAHPPQSRIPPAAIESLPKAAKVGPFSAGASQANQNIRNDLQDMSDREVLDGLVASVRRLEKIVGNALDIFDSRQKAHIAERKQLQSDISNLKEVMVETQGMVLQREFELRSQVSMLKKELYKFLPIEEITHEAVDLMFQSPICQQALLDKILKELLKCNLHEPTEAQIATATLNICFSQKMLAHMSMGKPSPTADVGMGWDKISLPESFLKWYDDVVSDIGKGNNEKVPKRQRTLKRRSGLKHPLSAELANSRNVYFFYLGRDAVTMEDWLLLRYKEKVEFAEKWFDTAREGRPLSIPTPDGELDLYLKVCKGRYNTREQLKTLKHVRTVMTLNNKKGQELNTAEIREVALKLSQVGYGGKTTLNYTVAEAFILKGDYEKAFDAMVKQSKAARDPDSEIDANRKRNILAKPGTSGSPPRKRHSKADDSIEEVDLDEPQEIDDDVVSLSVLDADAPTASKEPAKDPYGEGRDQSKDIFETEDPDETRRPDKEMQDDGLASDQSRGNKSTSPGDDSDVEVLNGQHNDNTQGPNDTHNGTNDYMDTADIMNQETFYDGENDNYDTGNDFI